MCNFDTGYSKVLWLYSKFILYRPISEIAQEERKVIFVEDVEIARSTKLNKIVDIASKIGIEEEELEPYGRYKAKISLKAYERLKNKKDGK